VSAGSSEVTVTGCDFMAGTIAIGENVKSAIVVGNRLRNGQQIADASKKAQIAYNTFV
jgi:hypothetical protein